MDFENDEIPDDDIDAEPDENEDEHFYENDKDELDEDEYMNGRREKDIDEAINKQKSCQSDVPCPSISYAPTNPTYSAPVIQNEMDDYEEGTWTPNLGGTATYVYNAGWYTKIGRVVVADFEVNVSSIGTGSTLSILGLPFTCGSTGNGQGGGIGYFSGAANSIYYLTARIDQGSTSISIATMLGPGAIMNTSVAFFTNSTRILGTITYMTAS